MAEPSTPSEIARETLRQLAMRRIPPTPDNYLALYHEISGSPPEEAFPEKQLKALITSLPHDTTEQMRYARTLDAAITEKDWGKFGEALSEAFSRGEPPAWASLLRELIVQLDLRNVGVTPAKKRESLEYILKTSPAPDLLFQRIQSLLSSWSQAPLAMDEAAQLEADHSGANADAKAAAENAAQPGISGELQSLMAHLLDEAISPLLGESPDLAKECAQLANAIRAARTPKQAEELASQLKKFSFRLNFVAEDQAELKGALLHLVHLIVENIGELVVDDQWLHGQIDAVNKLVKQPLSIRTLDDVERRLKDVIYKQSTLKHNLLEARNRIKVMLTTFVDRLGEFSATTDNYHNKIENFATRISKANDITDLSDVLNDVLHETRVIQTTAARSRDELHDMRQRVDEAEHEINRLQSELAQTSEMVRLDPLTGALNRKGLSEAFDREAARSRRHEGLLSVALLDIDNFKRINDELGHAVGDGALIHLSKVVQDTLRPQDTLARYGGEEFVILLPETSLNDAITVMTRVQRELTRNYFLHENDKLLITFSAGVAELRAEESTVQAIERADKAMYLAKRAGKNRVFAA